MTTPSRLVVWIALTIAAPAVADAKPKKPKGSAKAHVDKAAKAHKAGKFDEALAELEAAYAIDPQPKLLFAIAQVQAKLDNCTAAVESYEKFLTRTKDKQKRAVVKQAVDACKKSLAAAKAGDRDDSPFRAARPDDAIKPADAAPAVGANKPLASGKPTDATDKPATDKPATDKPGLAASKPATDKPGLAASKPATDKPATDKPAPAADKPGLVATMPAPAADKPIPVTDKPLAELSTDPPPPPVLLGASEVPPPALSLPPSTEPTTPDSRVPPSSPIGDPSPAISASPPETAARPWYRDAIGATLVGGGVIAGIGAIVLYVGARSALDEAEAAPRLADYESLVDGARDKRLYAIALAGSAVVLGAAGGLRYALRRSDEAGVAMTPSRGGALVTWSGTW